MFSVERKSVLRRALAFGAVKDGLYSLEAQDWKDGMGTLKYANKQYITSDGNVFLLVKVGFANTLGLVQHNHLPNQLPKLGVVRRRPMSLFPREPLSEIISNING